MVSWGRSFNGDATTFRSAGGFAAGASFAFADTQHAVIGLKPKTNMAGAKAFGQGRHQAKEGRTMDEKSDQASRQKVIDLIKDIDYAIFTTHGGNDQALHARPMAYRSVEGDGDLWFFTKRDSRKVQEIKANPSLLVAFADPKNQTYVSLMGRGQIVAERAKVEELWTEIYRTWFPGGPEDESIVLVRVRPDRAEYWDTPSSAMVYAYGYVKAVLTGTPAKPGDVGAVTFG